MEDQQTVAEVLEDIRARYEGLLSYRKMATEAGLVENLVYKACTQGTTPRPKALRALAERWGRTPDEKIDDFRRLMRAAGYVVAPLPAPRNESHFERLLSEVMDLPQAEREAWSLDQLVGLKLAHKKEDDHDCQYDDNGRCVQCGAKVPDGAASPGDEEAAI